MKRAAPKKLRKFKVGEGLPNLTLLSNELQDYTDVLMGRVEPPVQGVLSLMEVADTYFARASEIEMVIYRKVREGIISRSNPYNQFRTQELRTFKELAKRAADLGSRRLTAEALDFQKQQTGRESR
jgi:hypothetical protein